MGTFYCLNVSSRKPSGNGVLINDILISGVLINDILISGVLINDILISGALIMSLRSYSRAGSHDDAVLVNRGVAHVMLGEMDQAMADLTAAITLNPHTGHVYFNRANVYRSLGAMEMAGEDYIMALRLEPDDWLCQYYLSQTERQRDKES